MKKWQQMQTECSLCLSNHVFKWKWIALICRHIVDISVLPSVLRVENYSCEKFMELHLGDWCEHFSFTMWSDSGEARLLAAVKCTIKRMSKQNRIYKCASYWKQQASRRTSKSLKSVQDSKKNLIFQHSDVFLSWAELLSHLCLRDRWWVWDFWPGCWHRMEWRSWCFLPEDDSSCWRAAEWLYTYRRTASPAGWQSSPGSDKDRKWFINMTSSVHEVY